MKDLLLELSPESKTQQKIINDVLFSGMSQVHGVSGAQHCRTVRMEL
jgi:hypothetical protein